MNDQDKTTPAYDAQKYGRSNVAKMIKEVDQHRKMVRAEGTPAVQESWDAIEEHIDYAYGGDRDRLTARAKAAEAEVARLTEALKGMEYACEQLAATRTHEVYLAMIDSGQSDALIALDARRQVARETLAALRKGGAA